MAKRAEARKVEAAAQRAKVNHGGLTRGQPAIPPPPKPPVDEDGSDLIRYTDLYERTPVGLVTLDGAGRVVEANATLLRMLGGAPCGTVVGWPFELWVQSSHRALFLHHLYQTLRSKKTCSCHVVLATARGGPLFTAYLESIALAGPSGRRVCRMAVGDASARFSEEAEFGRILAAERALRARMEEDRRRVDRAAAASAELAESLDLATTARRAAEIGALHVAWYASIDLLGEEGHVRRASFARRDGDTADLPLDPYAPRGSARVVRTSRPELYPDATRGDLLGLVAAAADFAQLRHQVGGYLCIPLRAHGRTLGAMSFVAPRGTRFSSVDVALAEELTRHAALAIDNARLYCEAQDADRRKDEFLAMLGHELRNPLAAVVTAARAMLRREGDGDTAQRTAELVERQGTRLVRLVDDLLDVSRITRGKVTLQRRRVLLAEIAARAVESTRPLIQDCRHELRISRADAAVLLDADPARLEQVVVNLLANAAKYTPPGGSIELEIGAAGSDAVIRVRDTGVGIPRDQLQHIFSPFIQLDTTPDRTDRGLGIGLTLARCLVELHDGSIAARSEGPGRGSEFIVRLPRLSEAEVSPPPESSPRPLPPPSSSTPRRRVLLVEDHPDVAAAMRDELELLGQEVRTAEDGAEALAVAPEFQPELMLVDIGLPGMDGFEVATRLRRVPALKGITLVALTGYGGAETWQRCQEAGFDQHYTKPIGEEALLDLLQKAERCAILPPGAAAVTANG